MVIRALIAFLAAVWTICFAPTALAVDNDAELLKAGISSLAPKERQLAFSQFINVFQIVKPHPDADVEGFIKRARSGEGDSFALIAFVIWRGEAGFRTNKPAAKIALMRALTEGSKQAPYFIAQTFLQSSSGSDSEKLDNYLTGIQWLGVSAGLGEQRAHTEAMRLIDGSAKGNQEIRAELFKFYNLGLEQSRQYKRQP